MAVEGVLAIAKINDDFISTDMICVHLAGVVFWNAVDNGDDLAIRY